MIRIGFGMTNISVGFGPDLNLEAIIEVIRTAIGTDVMQGTTVVRRPAKVAHHEGEHHEGDHHEGDHHEGDHHEDHHDGDHHDKDGDQH